MKIWACLLVLVVISAGCSKAGVSVPAASNPSGASNVSEPSEPPDEACEVVYLGKSAELNMPLPPGPDRATLVREFFRQALLISARDELGLVTRDAWLGDAIPREGASRPFDLATRAGPPPRLEVLRGFPSAVRAIGTADLPSIATPEHYLRRLWVEAEKLSRTSLLEILTKGLGQRQARPWTPDLALPGSIEEPLREMSFLAQFKAARQIHDVMASRGQSPALLGALVRVYANLGVLTEFHWYPAHKVFKARAILYAQRWLGRQPDSLPALWHRAYALALAGDHADALEDLESAQKAWQAMAEKQRPPRPGWVALLDAYCRYDIEKLGTELDHPEHGQLAALLQYHAVEMAGNRRWALQTAATTLEKIPNCFRVHDGVCAFAGVSVSHLSTLAPFQILARTLYKQVHEMPGLPESVRGLAKRPADGQADFGGSLESMEPEFKARVRLIGALREASHPRAAAGAEAKPAPKSEPGKPKADAPGAGPSSRPPDAGEPSWASLAHLIQETSFIHVWRRANFERHCLGVPAEDFLTLAAPLVADHPLRPFVDTLWWDAVKRRQAIEQAARLEPEGLELHARPLLDGFYEFGTERAKQILAAMQFRHDALARDYVVLGRLIETDRKQLPRCAKTLLCVSPHSPLARAFLVEAGAASEAEIAAWEKSAGKYPFLAFVLARRCAAAKQWDDAVRFCQAAIKIVEDKAIYDFLANVYETKGDEGRWLETLEAALRLPDYGLDHAAIQKTIAWHFMNKKEWRRGLPYATAAAECYSCWGLLCAAACHEGLQEWEAAEKYVKAAAERYRESATEWYRFCRRTGHGDLQAARRLAKSYADDPSAQDSRNARLGAATFYILEGRLDQGLAGYGKAFAEEADPFFGLWVAILADELKDAKTRDAALARIRSHSPAVVRNDTGNCRQKLVELADLIERDLAQGGKGQIDAKAVDKLRAALPEGAARAYFDLFLARYLHAHGKRNEAIRCWKEEVASTDVLGYGRTFAGAALCDLGVKPESYKALLEKAPTAGAKPAPQPKKQGKKESNKEAKPKSAKPPGTAASSSAKTALPIPPRGC